MRLSQFLILPPYQSQGHGSELYNQVMQLALSRDNIVELTIEDPSEAFDRLRDTNDLKRLLSAWAMLDYQCGVASQCPFDEHGLAPHLTAGSIA